MSSPPNRSPGKGGKSLEQLRKAQISDGAAAPATQPSTQPPEHPSSVNPNTMPGSAPPLQPQTQSQATQLSSARPKGKDFASLSARQPVPPQPQVQPPLQQQQQQPSAPPQAQAGGKPKGKDFSQMASRIGPPTMQPTTAQPPQLTAGPPQSQQPPPSHQFQRPPSDASQQAARAAQMQAAARAAAGMPPLDRAANMASATAPPQNLPSSVSGMATTVPTPQPPGFSMQQPAASNATYPSQALAPSAMPQRQGQPMQRTASGGLAAPGPQHTMAPSAPAVKKTRENSKPTPAPTVHESRLSVSGAHRAPLIGPRIQQLVAEIDPNYCLDTQAEEQLLRLADDFLDKVCAASMKLAQHRNSKVLDVQDVQLVLQKQFNIRVPGLPPMSLASAKSPLSLAGMESHGARDARARGTSGVGAAGAGVRRKNIGGDGGSSAKIVKTSAGDVKSQP